MKLLTCLSLLPAALLITGCGSKGIDLAAARQMVAEASLDEAGVDGGAATRAGAKYLTQTYRTQAAKDENSSVLHHLRIGLAALREDQRQLAAESFDAALLVIETLYGGDEGAAAAREKYSAEEDKVFRGEPYERAMAYYYRGLLYLMESDYENARASFRSAFLQDSLAGSEVHQQDFAMLAYLEGWASQCNGDTGLAQEAYAIAQKYNADLALPDALADTLIVAEHGAAPLKYTAGEHDELLKIAPAKTRPAGEYYVKADGKITPLPNSESVAYQAITRGGRQFDAILKGKVEYKEGQEAIADVAATVGAVAKGASVILAESGALDDAMDSLGLGLAADVFSIFSQAKADKTNPAADTRQWDTLPEQVEYGAYTETQLSGGLRYGTSTQGETDAGLVTLFRPVEGGEVASVDGGDHRCKLTYARFEPVVEEAKVAANVKPIPEFMKKLDGCWETGFFSNPTIGGEYKVISGDTYLNQIGTSERFEVIKYRVTGANTWDWTSVDGVPHQESLWFVDDNTFKMAVPLDFDSKATRIPAGQCANLLLQ